MRATQAVGATLAFALALLAPPGVRGQSTDLTGTVVDSLTNEVLPSVLVSLGESSFGVLTDAFGRFAFGSSPDLCVKAEEAPRLRLGCLGDLLFLEE